MKFSASLLWLAAILCYAAMPTSSRAQKPSTPARQITDLRQVRRQTIEVDHLTIFYREAGDPNKPTLLLLHGFPSSSHMYNDLINELSANYHLVAPDYPGFGNSSLPSPDVFDYSFDHIADLMSDFIHANGLRDTTTVTKILQQIISFEGIKVQYTGGYPEWQRYLRTH